VDAPKSEEPRLELGPRDDEVLPEDLADAISQSARATAEAITRGNTRCQVEILLPEFWDPISGPIFPNRGDQERFWRITRRFVDELGGALALAGARGEEGEPVVNAVYPDAGVAAMLAHQWSADPSSFRLTSLNDRRPIRASDQLVVIACPDPPGANDCTRIVRQVGEQDEQNGVPERPVVLFNQRMSSGDVGLGLNARRLRDSFLRAFTVTYSLRPIGDIGSVYKRYPDTWKVFLEDPQLPGRYKLVSEQPSRPQGEYLDYIIQQALGNGPDGQGGPGGEQQGGAAGLLSQLQRTANSLQYFMKSLTK